MCTAVVPIGVFPSGCHCICCHVEHRTRLHCQPIAQANRNSCPTCCSTLSCARDMTFWSVLGSCVSRHFDICFFRTQCVVLVCAMFQHPRTVCGRRAVPNTDRSMFCILQRHVYKAICLARSIRACRFHQCQAGVLWFRQQAASSTQGNELIRFGMLLSSYRILSTVFPFIALTKDIHLSWTHRGDFVIGYIGSTWSFHGCCGFATYRSHGLNCRARSDANCVN